LEDIKAPECFAIEERLKRQMGIPVFHDDQHGTAIISGAALVNALELQGKAARDVTVVFSGAGAAAISCARHYVNLGVRRENIMVVDSKGVVTEERTEGMNPYKAEFAAKTAKRTLSEAMEGADVFAGLSLGGLVTPQMVQSMADKPIIFAMANPDPEIGYHEAKVARPDVIMATGRSDYPNQVNNVLGFPFIFRGALDVRASDINEPMKIAATKALAEVAKQADVPGGVLDAYGLDELSFGPDYIIPKPMDPRVLVEESLAVAQAAMDSGVASEPVADIDAYRKRLTALAETIQKA
jgi:malate dehydrogenase (oxaloacetate-decarboxylating)(NADP+)